MLCAVDASAVVILALLHVCRREVIGVRSVLKVSVNVVLGVIGPVLDLESTGKRKFTKVIQANDRS